MIEFIDMTLAFCVALGFALGIISGLTPGLHLNNFASMPSLPSSSSSA